MKVFFFSYPTKRLHIYFNLIINMYSGEVLFLLGSHLWTSRGANRDSLSEMFLRHVSNQLFSREEPDIKDSGHDTAHSRTWRNCIAAWNTVILSAQGDQ